MRVVLRGVALFCGVLGWAACVGDAASPGGDGLVDSGGDGSSSSSGSSTSSGSTPEAGTSSGGSSSGGSSSGDTDAGCELDPVTGLCPPVTLKADLQNPYGVTVTTVGDTTLAVWVRGAPEAAGAVERCDVRQCEASVVKVADTVGANGIDAYDGPHPVSGRSIVTDGDWVRWISFSDRAQQPPRPRDLLGGCSLLGGCMPPLAVEYTELGPHSPSQLDSAGGSLFLRDTLGAVLGCSMASCADPGSVAGGDAYRRSVATDGTTLAWIQPHSSVLSFCRRDGAQCAAGSTRSAGNVSAYGDTRHTILTMAGGRLLGASSTTVWACTVDSCQATLHTLGTNLVNATAIATDGVNAYWATAGSGSGAGDTGVIESCPIDGCGANPPRRLASGLYDPRALHLHQGVLYWVSYGNADRAGSLQSITL